MLGKETSNSAMPVKLENVYSGSHKFMFLTAQPLVSLSVLGKRLSGNFIFT